MIRVFALVEAGGTKLVLAICDENRAILEETRIPTTDPEQTLTQAARWMTEAATRHGSPSAIGIASFGPIETDRAASNWGSVLRTPKAGWTGADIVAPFREAFNVPVGFDTDVNAAALAEYEWGSARHAKGVVYITIGTGIGGGAVLDGRILSGIGHAEMGHLRVPRHPADGNFAGICPFHADCLEGLASGPAILERWGRNLSELPPEHAAHDIVAFYIGQLCTSLQAFMEPEKILLGGGVMETPGLLGRVRDQASSLAAGYFRGDPQVAIDAPGLAPRSGIYGALALALRQPI